jgi:D-glycero-D-manno-heptose 1,7-bisphosphate phosphatase
LISAVFLDRDGVINVKAPEGDYVVRWEDFHILPGVLEGLRLLTDSGVPVIVVTNQRCVAKGLLTTAELEGMHQRMREFVTQGGAKIDAVYYCPHEMRECCGCRKPAPGMFVDAARDYGIDLPTSWMIGDSDIDVEAGKNAGCKTARLLTKSESGAAGPKTEPDIVAFSLLDAVNQILRVKVEAYPREYTIKANLEQPVSMVSGQPKKPGGL